MFPVICDMTDRCRSGAVARGVPHHRGHQREHAAVGSGSGGGPHGHLLREAGTDLLGVRKPAVPRVGAAVLGPCVVVHVCTATSDELILIPLLIVPACTQLLHG